MFNSKLNSKLLHRTPFYSLAFVVASTMFMLVTSDAMADIQDPPGADYGPTRKLSRGVNNILFGGVEIPYQVNYITGKEGGAAGITHGLARGIGRTVKRFGYGLYETATFLFPTYKASYRIPYRTDPPWINGGMTEFAPEMGWDSRYPYVRGYRGY